LKKEERTTESQRTQRRTITEKKRKSVKTGVSMILSFLLLLFLLCG
jgi:hypothetical protein